MTTHLAGTPVNVIGRWIQRCLVCGEKLVDSENHDMITTEGKIYVSFWPVGGIIRIDGKNSSCIGITEIPEIIYLPENFCLDLVE